MRGLALSALLRDRGFPKVLFVRATPPAGIGPNGRSREATGHGRSPRDDRDRANVPHGAAQGCGSPREGASASRTRADRSVARRELTRGEIANCNITNSLIRLCCPRPSVPRSRPPPPPPSHTQSLGGADKSSRATLEDARRILGVAMDPQQYDLRYVLIHTGPHTTPMAW